MLYTEIFMLICASVRSIEHTQKVFWTFCSFIVHTPESEIRPEDSGFSAVPIETVNILCDSNLSIYSCSAFEFGCRILFVAIKKNDFPHLCCVTHFRIAICKYVCNSSSRTSDMHSKPNTNFFATFCCLFGRRQTFLCYVSSFVMPNTRHRRDDATNGRRQRQNLLRLPPGVQCAPSLSRFIRDSVSRYMYFGFFVYSFCCCVSKWWWWCWCCSW